MIIRYSNKYKSQPLIIDSTGLFNLYKPQDDNNQSIVTDYFQDDLTVTTFPSNVDYEDWKQFSDYMKLNYLSLAPFIKRYFSPSPGIQILLRGLESKYNLDYSNLTVLFYRGNDKVREIPNAPYQDYIDRAKIIEAANPGMRFLVQSDETEFIDLILTTFPNAFYFKDETRHIPRSNTTVDLIYKSQNYLYSKYYLAITLAMSKAKNVICGSGNCSIWICLYRGNAEGVQQFLKTAWI